MIPDNIDHMPAHCGKYTSMSTTTNNNVDRKSSFETLHLPNQPDECDSVVEAFCKKLEQCMLAADCTKRRPAVVAKTSSGVNMLEGGEERRHRSVDM